MKRLSAVYLCMLLLGGGSVSAQGDTAPLPDIGTYTVDARTARIATLRDKYKIVLTPTDKQHITEHCGYAQKNLGKLLAALPLTLSSRLTTYDKVVVDLTSTRSRLDGGVIDVSGLDLLIVDYQQKRQAFLLGGDEYYTALLDSTRINCASSPEDFKASVEGVREARKKLVGTAKDIRETTDSTLKTTFDSLIVRLRKQQPK